MKKDITYLVPPESLRFGSLGNGITVYTTAFDDPGTHDYLTLAHINEQGKITWRVRVDNETYQRIKEYAKAKYQITESPLANTLLFLN